MVNIPKFLLDSQRDVANTRKRCAKYLSRFLDKRFDFPYMLVTPWEEELIWQLIEFLDDGKNAESDPPEKTDINDLPAFPPPGFTKEKAAKLAKTVAEAKLKRAIRSDK